MRVKSKYILTSILFVVLLSVALFAVVALQETPTASAEESEDNCLTFNYKYIFNDDVNIAENRVKKSKLFASGDGEKTCEVYFTLNSSFVSIDVGGDVMNCSSSKSIRIRAISNFNIASFEIKNSEGEVVVTSTSNMCRGTLNEGEYQIIYIGQSTWAEIENGEKVIKTACIECNVNLTIDSTPPTIESSIGEFGIATNQGFAISAKDNNTATKLFYKFPGMTSYACAESMPFYVSPYSLEGKYYFYATDELNNRTSTCWIELLDNPIEAQIIKSKEDNSIYFSWEGEDLIAILDGTIYTKSTWIRTEGEHELVLSNIYGKERIYSFKIDHFYKETNRTAATCIKDGEIKYECSQCGDKYSEVLRTSGHKYNVTSTPSSCTECEVVTYTCELCGAKYETEGNYPSGHNYESTVTKEPTCTEKGERKVVCTKCGDSYTVTLAENGHDYAISDVTSSKGKTTRTYTCKDCNHSYKQELGNQYEEVSNYVEYLFQQYSPYMWWVLLASAGIWSIVIGVMIAIAHKNEDKEKTKKMLVNYVLGLVVIAVILVACPYLVRGIAALIT